MEEKLIFREKIETFIEKDKILLTARIYIYIYMIYDLSLDKCQSLSHMRDSETEASLRKSINFNTDWNLFKVVTI